RFENQRPASRSASLGRLGQPPQISSESFQQGLAEAHDCIEALSCPLEVGFCPRGTVDELCPCLVIQVPERLDDLGGPFAEYATIPLEFCGHLSVLLNVQSVLGGAGFDVGVATQEPH